MCVYLLSPEKHVTAHEARDRAAGSAIRWRECHASARLRSGYSESSLSTDAGALDTTRSTSKPATQARSASEARRAQPGVRSTPHRAAAPQRVAAAPRAPAAQRA